MLELATLLANTSPVVQSLFVDTVERDKARIRLAFKFNGFNWITAAAASCALVAGGPAVWTESVSVRAGSGNAFFWATGLVPNNTYTCSGNISTATATSADAASPPFTTKAVVFRSSAGATGDRLLAAIGGATSSSAGSVNVTSEVHVFNADSNAWFLASVTAPAAVYSASCTYDEASTVYCSGGQVVADASTSEQIGPFLPFYAPASSFEAFSCTV
eukprot:tig00021717_g23142.t1